MPLTADEKTKMDAALAELRTKADDVQIFGTIAKKQQQAKLDEFKAQLVVVNKLRSDVKDSATGVLPQTRW